MVEKKGLSQPNIDPKALITTTKQEEAIIPQTLREQMLLDLGEDPTILAEREIKFTKEKPPAIKLSTITFVTGEPHT